MGYIKFKKAVIANGGKADLLHCDDIMHVGIPTATEIVLTFGENSAVDTATLAYASQTDFSTIRDAINDAIELGNGASGPAITVNMVAVSSITIA